MGSLVPFDPSGVERALARWRRGEDPEESFRVVVEAWYPRLHRFFAARTGDETSAHDLTQETLVGIYAGVNGFRADASFETWLFTVAANVLRKSWRDSRALKRGAGRPIASLDDEATSIEVPAEDPDPLDAAIRSQELSRLQAAIEELPAKMRAVLKLYFYQDRSRQEIAEAMGVSAETVKAHLMQARRRLAALLGGDGNPEDPT